MRDRTLTVEIRQQQTIPLDVHFECRAGQTLALIGPSGAGKTTILRTIAGLYTPNAARVVCGDYTWLDTKTRTNVAAHERHTGFVFQSYALFPHLTARGNVEVALSHLPSERRREAADALLTRVNLRDAAERRPSALSGGEQQRVALARALARDPQVLLLDEPFSAIDRRTRRQLQSDIATLKHELQAPIVLVTHDLDEAVALADELVVIDRGQLLQSGPTSEVMENPLSESVRAILDLNVR